MTLVFNHISYRSSTASSWWSWPLAFYQNCCVIEAQWVLYSHEFCVRIGNSSMIQSGIPLFQLFLYFGIPCYHVFFRAEFNLPLFKSCAYHYLKDLFYFRLEFGWVLFCFSSSGWKMTLTWLFIIYKNM